MTISASPFSLMERMLEWAVTDNREASAATLPQHTENAVRLLHIVQDFLQAEGLVNPALWTDKVLEETVTLMDSLMVWYSAGTQWFQLCQVGLRLLLGFMAQEDPNVRWCFCCLHPRFNCIAVSFCKSQTYAITLITDLSLRSVLWPLPSLMVSCRLRRCLVRMRPATYWAKSRASCGDPSWSKPRRCIHFWFLCCEHCCPKCTDSSIWSYTSPNSLTPMAVHPSLRTSRYTATHPNGVSTSINTYELLTYSHSIYFASQFEYISCLKYIRT